MVADGVNRRACTTANGVFTFSLTNIFQATINGTNSTVTGLTINWITGQDCNDWSTNVGGANMNFGVHDDAASAALSVGTQACSNAGKVVCVEH